MRELSIRSYTIFYTLCFSPGLEPAPSLRRTIISQLSFSLNLKLNHNPILLESLDRKSPRRRPVATSPQRRWSGSKSARCEGRWSAPPAPPGRSQGRRRRGGPPGYSKRGRDARPCLLKPAFSRAKCNHRQIHRTIGNP